MIISTRNLHQILACSPVVVHQFLIGLGWGWTAPTIKKLRYGNLSESPFTISSKEASYMASIGEMGRISGPVITPLIVDRIGRQYTIVLAALSLLIIWPTLIFLRDPNLICVERMIFGIINGMFVVVSSIYTAENCSSGLRAAMGGILTVVYSGGYFVELILATYLSYKNTAIVNTLISGCGFFSLYFCIETPPFLIMKKKYSEAEKRLEWLHGGQAAGNQSNQMEKLKHSVEEERQKGKSIKLLFTSAANLKSMCTVTCMYLISAATGNSAINPHAAMIFPPSEILTSDNFAILYGLSNFISACMAPIIVPIINRRTVLIASFSLIGFCHACTFLLFYFHNRNYEIAFYPWLVFASIALFGSARAIYIPAMFVIRAELLPMSVRAIGGSMAIIISSMAGFCIAKIFLPLTEYAGMEINFLIYCVMSIVMVIMIYYFLLETRGKSLDEIQNELKNSVKLDDNADRT